MINFNEALNYVNSFDKLGKPVNDLNRIEALLYQLGDPHKSLKYIHITGTNGKGSVAQMCSQTMMHAGYRVGLFTSPYIVEYTDRIKCNNENISKDIFCRIVNRIMMILEDVEYRKDFSQFEISVAIGMLYFNYMRCDIVILEVGIGGLLDATNVISKPVVSIITSVAIDHMKILGETEELIAYQKAGIIKPFCPCVLSCNNSSKVVSVVKRECDKKGSQLFIPDYKDVHMYRSGLMGSEIFYKGNNYKIRMCGDHQVINAITVIEAMAFVIKAGYCIKEEDIHYGLKTAEVHGRVEVISTEPLVIIDGAHNVSGMKALARFLAKQKYKNGIAVIGMVKDKQLKATIQQLAPYITEFICVDGYADNAVRSDQLSSIIREIGLRAFSVYDLNLALTQAKDLINHDDMLLICGSLYLASDARKKYIPE